MTTFILGLFPDLGVLAGENTKASATHISRAGLGQKVSMGLLGMATALRTVKKSQNTSKQITVSTTVFLD